MTSSHVGLPIDALLPEIESALAAHSAVVIEAPPGAGKTTRVPPFLLELFSEGEVVVLEPRRLAAHLSAVRVAEELGEALGETVGVEMRYESVRGPSTRLRYVTEGVLLRQLQRDPTLHKVRAVVLDEFHERHLPSDLLLALMCALLRKGGARPDLKLCVMSATLHSGEVAAFLGNCPVIKSSGRSFPVDIEYVTELADEPLWKRVRGALRRVLREDDGDVLVFLPGSAEIRRCEEELGELAAQANLSVLPLYGELPLVDQRRAVTPRRPGEPRKIILATNVAETSLTIDGVTVVIDSGLARVAGLKPWSGLPTLRVQPISRAQAAQRAGRAGRTKKGRCLRLYSKLDHDARPEFETPEIQRLDLCELLLLLSAAGHSVGELRFLDPPPSVALAAAARLLTRLGACDENGALTDLGHALCALPIHPRLGRLLVSAVEAGLGDEGTTIAALLSERDIRTGRAGASVHGPSDVLHLLDLFAEARSARFARSAMERMGLDPDVVLTVERARNKLRQAASALSRLSPRSPRVQSSPAAAEETLLRAILSAYPDRVAKRRGKGSGNTSEFVLASGGSAVLSSASVVQEFEFVVLVDVEERSQGKGASQPARTMIRLASAVAADWLLELPGEGISESCEAVWNESAGRVELLRRLQYEQLVLDESRTPGDGGDEAQQSLLYQKAMASELLAFADGAELPRFLAQLALCAEHGGEGALAPPQAGRIEQVVRTLCQGRSSLSELRSLSIIDALCAEIEQELAKKEDQTPGKGGRGRPLRAELSRLLPEFVTLGRGRRVRVHYEAGKPPWVESRLQDFFGMVESPRVFAGRVPLVLHLLAPNQRAVQVTTDLAGFWSRHYPAIRRELCRRYPKHAWPENPSLTLED